MTDRQSGAAVAPHPARGVPAVFGAGSTTVLHDGRVLPVTQLNNAATTPPFTRTVRALPDFLGSYGALHRGAGPRARETVRSVEVALDRIRRFIGHPGGNGLLFTPNTSAAINLLARLVDLGPDDVVVTSEIEHTSNNLPWRYNTGARVVEVRADVTGALDLDHLAAVLAEHRGRVAWVAVTGASNMTGYCPELRTLADLTHRAGARLFVDAAQLAPHRSIDMAADSIDALAFSAHKVYAPFGLGVLSLPEQLLRRRPLDPGGGSIDMLADSGDVVWAPPAERHQTGTWNVTGIVAAGESCAEILDHGWDGIRAHEQALVEYAVATLAEVPGVRPAFPLEHYLLDARIGAFPFVVDGVHHALAAAVLEAEHGIEVRAGTICNHRLVRRWIGVDDVAQARVERAMAAGDRLAGYGVVRASLACHTTTEDIDRLGAALTELAADGPRLRYRPLPEHEAYEPLG